MFCVRCGKEIDDKADVCIHCGVYTEPQKKLLNDSSSALLALFAFFFPVVGIVLWLVYENSRPLRANSFKKGAITGFVLYGIFAAIAVLFYVFMIVYGMYGMMINIF